LRRKRVELEAALTGRVPAHHRFLLAQHLVHMDFLDEQIEQFTGPSPSTWRRTRQPKRPSNPTGRRAPRPRCHPRPHP
jgi:hypothetical protein